MDPTEDPYPSSTYRFPASPGSQALLCPGTVWITMLRHEQQNYQVLFFFPRFPMVCARDCHSTEHGRKGHGNRGRVSETYASQGRHDPAPFLLKPCLGPPVGSVAEVCLLALAPSSITLQLKARRNTDGCNPVRRLD